MECGIVRVHVLVIPLRLECTAAHFHTCAFVPPLTKNGIEPLVNHLKSCPVRDELSMLLEHVSEWQHEPVRGGGIIECNSALVPLRLFPPHVQQRRSPPSDFPF